MRQNRMLAAGLAVVTAAAVLGDSAVLAGKEARPVTGQEVTVVALVVHPRTHQPVVVLEGRRDRRRVALVIGPAEATGIAVPLHNITPPRPLTHDLLLTVFGRLNVSVRRAIITDLRNDVYYATLVLVANGTEMELDARPSDAIALVLRAKVPLLVEDRVFDKAEKLTPAPAPDEPGQPPSSI